MKEANRQIVINGKPRIDRLSKSEAEIFFNELLSLITEALNKPDDKTKE